MRTVKPRAGQPWYDNDRSRQNRLEMDFSDTYALGLARTDAPELRLPPPGP